MSEPPARLAGRYTIERELVAEEDLRRWAATDSRDGDAPVEIVAPRAHALMRPGAREGFDTLTGDDPAYLPVLERLESGGTPMRVRPRTQGTLAGVTLTAEDAWALARWLLPAITTAGGAFGGELRPEDIAVDAAGVPRLAAVRLPRPESVSRIPFHRAPELADGAAPTVAADLYGFGVLLYRAVAGVDPYPATSPAQLKLRSLDARPVSDHTAVSPELDALVTALVSLDPATREAAAATALASLDGAPATAPTITLSTAHDAPFAARTALARPPAPPMVEAGPFLVTAPLAGRTPDERARIALASGVEVAAVDAAATRRASWVLDHAGSEGEAERLARRYAARGLAVVVQANRAPAVAQFAAMALVVALCGVFTPFPFSLGVFALAALIALRAAWSLRGALRVAETRLALAERQRAPLSAGAGGKIHALELRLRDATHLPAPLRTDLKDALDAAWERAATLLTQRLAVAAGENAPADLARQVDAEEERLVRELKQLEVELTRAHAETAATPDSPAMHEVGRLARVLAQKG